jgi:hypothetical protein
MTPASVKVHVSFMSRVRIEGSLTPVGVSSLSLSNTVSEGGGLDESVGGIGSGTRLANDDLVSGHTTSDNLEGGGSGPLSRGSLDQSITGGVLGRALVVELDVVPVDEITNLGVDLVVCVGELLLREPGSERGVGEDELVGGELSAEGLGEVDEPLLSDTVVGVHAVKVLVVNINTVEKVVLNVGGKVLCNGGRVSSGGDISGTESRDDEADASVGILQKS